MVVYELTAHLCFMAYSQFTLKKVVDDFNLTLVEQGDFLAPVQAVSLSPYLNEFLTKNLQLAIALNTEKARSELLRSPLLLAVKEALNNNVSLFSGEEFNVDAEVGLTGVCDYLISRAPEQLFIKAPVAVSKRQGGRGQFLAGGKPHT